VVTPSQPERFDLSRSSGIVILPTFVRNLLVHFFSCGLPRHLPIVAPPDFRSMSRPVGTTGERQQVQQVRKRTRLGTHGVMGHVYAAGPMRGHLPS
jgi:hypothetical protein